MLYEIDAGDHNDFAGQWPDLGDSERMTGRTREPRDSREPRSPRAQKLPPVPHLLGRDGRREPQ